MPLTSHFGVFKPADLEIIKRVFERLFDERRLAQKDRAQREQLAAEVVRVFQQGATVEADLWRSLTKRRQGQNGARNVNAP